MVDLIDCHHMKFFSYFEQLGLQKQLFNSASVDKSNCILRGNVNAFPFFYDVLRVICNRFYLIGEIITVSFSIV